MKKKVCHISTAHSETDGRILYKECTSLIKAGYNVSYVVTSDCKKSINGVNIIPLKKSNGRIDRFVRKRKEAYKKALEVDADIYHFHDPELLGVGNKLKKQGKKVIYDSHEDTPKQILSKNYLGFMWMRKIVANIFRIYEKNISQKFDAIVSPQDARIPYFLNINSNTVKIENYALRSEAVKTKAFPRNEDEKDKLILIYVGSITKIRGIREIITPLPQFEGKVELWLLGTWENDEIREQCEKLEGYKYTRYLGCVPGDEIYSYIKSADIGLSVLYPTENYKEAIPTKVFDYMSCNKPVILSNFYNWEKLFGDVGIYVDPLNVEEIVQAVKKYLDNKEFMIKQGEKNRKTFDEKFSWEMHEREFLDIYEKM